MRFDDVIDVIEVDGGQRRDIIRKEDLEDETANLPTKTTNGGGNPHAGDKDAGARWYYGVVDTHLATTKRCDNDGPPMRPVRRRGCFGETKKKYDDDAPPMRPVRRGSNEAIIAIIEQALAIVSRPPPVAAA